VRSRTSTDYILRTGVSAGPEPKSTDSEFNDTARDRQLVFDGQRESVNAGKAVIADRQGVELDQRDVTVDIDIRLCVVGPCDWVVLASVGPGDRVAPGGRRVDVVCRQIGRGGRSRSTARWALGAARRLNRGSDQRLGAVRDPGKGLGRGKRCPGGRLAGGNH
jgi:hypothetical protein